MCVGNETQVSWSAHRSPVDTLIGHVRRVRAQVAVPVTVADDFNYWNKPESRTLAAEIDFITMHAHPMWNGRQLEDALTWLRDQVTARSRPCTRNAPSCSVRRAGPPDASDQGEQGVLIKGRPGEIEQKQFHDDVRDWAASDRLTVFFFEAFDENWKGGANPAEVEKHWGLFRADRSPKAAMASDSRN